MLVKLKVMRGSHAGKEIRIPIAHFFIGRGEECHLRPASDLISRKHCALLVEEHRVVLQDFGSKNGSYVNGRRVEGSWVLESGDILQIGPLQFEVLLEAVTPTRRPVIKSVKEAAARAAEATTDREEEDVFQWLEGPEDPASLTRDMDSRVFKLQETQQLDPEEITTQSDSDSGIRDAVDSTHKKATRIPDEKKKTSRRVGDDSREAAAETLRRFFNRR